MKIVRFSLEEGNRYFGTIDGKRFLIGRRVSFEGGKGLMNVSGTAAQKYDRTQFRADFGFWADFIHPTAVAEGGFFHTLNTYDRARFTFSFLQFAAHVPNGDFVLYLRALLALPLAAEYFPDLKLENNRIVQMKDNGDVALESDSSTAALMDYLNPTTTQVEDTEVFQSARFIHWVQNDPLHRKAQVQVGIDLFRRKMKEYALRYRLDGKPDTICLVIADIRHQGRGNSSAILAALEAANPLNALLAIGEPKYPTRLVTLRREINKLVQEGVLGAKKYSLADRDFVAA